MFSKAFTYNEHLATSTHTLAKPNGKAKMERSEVKKYTVLRLERDCGKGGEGRRKGE